MENVDSNYGGSFRGTALEHQENLGTQMNTKQAKEIVVPWISMDISNMTVDDYMKLPYSVVLTPEDESGFSARVPDLPGCFSQGETAQEAYDNTREAMYNWIKATLDKGKEAVPFPRPNTRVNPNYFCSVTI